MSRQKKNDAYVRDIITKFLRHKLAVIGLIILLIEILLLIFLPMVMDLQPNTITSIFYGDPSTEHILGTDSAGRDVFARLIYGGRTSLLIGVLAVAVQALIGIPLGIIAGYYRKFAEAIIMRLADMFQSIPSMCINIALVSVFSPSVATLVIILGVMGWTGFARLMYAKVISIREKEYIEGARAIGCKDSVIMLRYILPNAISPALVGFTFGIPGAILSESALSFLGLGVQIPQATWGNMLNAAQSLAIISLKPWLWIPPGMCIFVTLICFNLFGDGLRDAIDPKTRM
jgi:peptide/nickel transport system permease protein